MHSLGSDLDLRLDHDLVSLFTPRAQRGCTCAPVVTAAAAATRVEHHHTAAFGQRALYQVVEFCFNLRWVKRKVKWKMNRRHIPQLVVLYQQQGKGLRQLLHFQAELELVQQQKRQQKQQQQKL